MTLGQIRASKALRFFVAAGIALGVLVTPTPASAFTFLGGRCEGAKYILMDDGYVHDCNLVGETFWSCYYKCGGCVDC